MPPGLVLVTLQPETPPEGRQRVRRSLEQLGARFELEFQAGFICRMDQDHAPVVRTWPHVHVAGGVHFRRKEVPRIQVPLNT